MNLAEILNVPEVAELLGCAEATLEEATRRGELPGLAYGRSWIYPRDALLKVLNDQALAEMAARKAPAPSVRPTTAPPSPRPGKRRNVPPSLNLAPTP